VLEREGVEIPLELRIPDCPPQLAHVMTWFEELSAQRRRITPVVLAGMGVKTRIIPQLHPLVWADMDAWSRNTRQRPTPIEWGVIQQLEARYMLAAGKAAAASSRM
jgi:hypothetical protein